VVVGTHLESDPTVPTTPLPEAPRYVNRELSRLDFDERVLAMAEDVKLPILERVQFLAIFSQNLDDFFQVRVAGLKEQVLAAVAVASPDGMSPLEQLKAIRARVESLVERQVSLFNREIAPALAESGITVVRANEVTKRELSHLHSVFRQQIFPVLTPLAVDPGHPFPYISHLSLNLAVLVRDPQRQQQHFARVKVPPVLPRFIPLVEGQRYIPLEDVIALHLQALFPGMEVVAHHPFRVTRDGDLDDVDSEAEDLLVERPGPGQVGNGQPEVVQAGRVDERHLGSSLSGDVPCCSPTLRGASTASAGAVDVAPVIDANDLDTSPASGP